MRFISPPHSRFVTSSTDSLPTTDAWPTLPRRSVSQCSPRSSARRCLAGSTRCSREYDGEQLLSEGHGPHRTALRLGYASHGDDDLSLSVSFSHVPESVGDLAQLVTPVDDRCHFPGLEKLSQDHHVRLVELRHKEDDLLAATHCRQAYLGDVTQGSDHTVALRCSDDDEGRLRVEYAPAL